MRSVLIAVAFVLLALTNAIAQPVLPRAVDLDAPGVLEALARSNPTHFVVIQRILAEAGGRPPADVPRRLRASLHAQSGIYQPILVTGHSPPRRLSVTRHRTP